MRRYGMLNELPASVSEKHQTAEQLEANLGHDEQVSGGNPSSTPVISLPFANARAARLCKQD